MALSSLFAENFILFCVVYMFICLYDMREQGKMLNVILVAREYGYAIGYKSVEEGLAPPANLDAHSGIHL